MGSDWIAGLKVVELKDELKKRGLSSTGNKAVLAQRLTEYVEANEGPGSGPSKEPTPAPAAGEEQQEEEDEQEQEDDAAAEADDVKPAAEGEPAAAAEEPAAEEPAAEEPAVTAEEPTAEEPTAEEATAEEPAAVAAAAEADAAPAPAEEVLDFDDEAEQHEHADEDQPVAAAVEDQDEKMGDAAAALGKRSVNEREPDEQQEAVDATPAAEQQQSAKRSKRTPIPPPESSKPAAAVPAKPAATAKVAATADGAAGTSSPAAVGAAADLSAADGGSERKRKHAPIPLPPARSASRELPRQNSNAGTAAVAAPTADQEALVAEAVAAAGDVPAEATAALLITGLKRPFTPVVFDEKLMQTGVVQSRWLTKLKDKAYVIMKDAAHAHATRASLNGTEWPVGNKSILSVEFMSVEVAKEAIDSQTEPAPPAPLRPAGSGAVGILARLGSGPAAAAAAAAKQEATAPAAAAAATDSQTDAAAAAKGSVRGRGTPAAGAGAGAAEQPAAKRQHVVPEHVQQQEPEPVQKQQQQPPQQQQPDPEPAVLTLDDLFKKTNTKPCLYWLPLTDEQVAEKKKRAAANEGSGGGARGSEPAGPAVQEGLGKPRNRY